METLDVGKLSADSKPFERVQNLRLIAFYLPQYHPIPENDEWWGKGFTEWTNVTKAKPLFEGHNQPHLPADLGFYDLRLAEVREAQADLARKYGVYGFCYYHYWFNGRRLLERPFAEVLATGKPDFPFCLCWANENWTRGWDGAEHQVLVQQNYSSEDDRQHIRWLAQAFADTRYIRVDGKPIFLVYRTARLPDPKRTTDVWRDEARRQGLGELFLVRVETYDIGSDIDPMKIGFDASVEFMPDWRMVASDRLSLREWWTPWASALALLSQDKLEKIRAFEKTSVFQYESIIEKAMARAPALYERFRCVSPGWDNHARRPQGGGHMVVGSTPELYGKWLRSVVEDVRTRPADHQLLFVNAWNEWGEGNHLEPCRQSGHAYLEATRNAIFSE